MSPCRRFPLRCARPRAHRAGKAPQPLARPGPVLSVPPGERALSYHRDLGRWGSALRPAAPFRPSVAARSLYSIASFIPRRSAGSPNFSPARDRAIRSKDGPRSDVPDPRSLVTRSTVRSPDATSSSSSCLSRLTSASAAARALYSCSTRRAHLSRREQVCRVPRVVKSELLARGLQLKAQQLTGKPARGFRYRLIGTANCADNQ